MNFITEIIEKGHTYNFAIGSSSWVDVTSINNPNSFYVRPASLGVYLRAIETPGEKATISDLLLEPNVIYKSETLRCYRRGKILRVNDDKISCDIFAIDVGCLEKSILLSDIHKPNHKIVIPPLAVHCQLANCQPKTNSWTPKETDAMRYFVGDEKAKIIVKGKSHDQLIVKLINNCSDDISTMLGLTGYLTFYDNGTEYIRIPRLCPEKYHFRKFYNGDTLLVRTLSGKNLSGFYVAHIDDYKLYSHESFKFQSFSQEKCSIRPEEMKENKPVSVFVSHLYRYERAMIKTITVPEKKAFVQLVDVGTIIEVDVSQMKSMYSGYFVNPAIAIYCSLDESQLWENNLQKYLHPGFEYMITIVAKGEEFDCPHIVKILPTKNGRKV